MEDRESVLNEECITIPLCLICLIGAHPWIVGKMDASSWNWRPCNQALILYQYRVPFTSRAISSLLSQNGLSVHWSSTSRSHSPKAAFDVGLIADFNWLELCRLATGADAWTRWLVRDLASPQWGLQYQYTLSQRNPPLTRTA